MNQLRVFILSQVVGLALLPGLVFGQSPSAAAESRWYANLDVGGQIKSQTLSVPSSFPLYDETATMTSTVKIGSGTIFNLEAGARVSENGVVGVAFTQRFKDTANAAVDASLPHPLFFDTFRSATGTASGLGHSEYAIHISGGWRFPVASRFDLRVFGGASIFHLSQDLVDTLTVEETGPPYTTVSISGGAKAKVSKTDAGFHIGLDGTYLLTERFGVGVLARYSHASADVATGDNPKVSVDLGGFEVGGGLRVRF